MYKEQKYIEKPLQLVSMDKQSHLTLNQQTLQYIRSIKGPIGILSIAGPYRTGKSFLLNTLISKNQAFQVGDTTQATTHGLWVWGKPILANDMNSKLANIIVMDSQGFGNFQDTHDKRITTLALLLSTCFLYNSRGTIDKDSIFDLQYVIDIARSICVTENIIHRTDFHWILRDFHLQLVNQMGQNITANQYLENSLYQSQQKVSKTTIQTLKSYFQNRNCHTLVKPNLKGEDQQRPQFVEQIIQLRKIFNGIRTMQIDGIAFVEILKSYVQSINNGETLPKIFQEGYQCRVRLTCLQKLQSQLKQIEESFQTFEQIEVKVKQLRIDLHNYSKERMCSNHQLAALDIDINQIIAQFQQEVKPKQTTSIKVVQRRQPKKNNAKKSSFYQGKSKLNIRIKQLVEEVQFAKSMKDNQIKFQKSQQARIKQQYEGKIHRLQLELGSAKRQAEYYRQQFEKVCTSSQVVEDKMNQTAQFSQKKDQENKFLIAKLIVEVQQLKNSKILANSQIDKLQILSQQKIAFLEKCLRQSQQSKKRVQRQYDDKYKDKISQLMIQIQILSKSHQKQLQNVKDIYKTRTQALIPRDSNCASEHDDNFIEDIKKYMKEIEQLNQSADKLRYHNSELQSDINNWKQQIKQMKNAHKQQIQQLQKRNKQKQSYNEAIYNNKLSNKQQLIKQLENKNKHLNKFILQLNETKIQTMKVDEKEEEYQQRMYLQQFQQLQRQYEELNQKYLKLENQLKQKEQCNLQQFKQNQQLRSSIYILNYDSKKICEGNRKQQIVISTLKIQMNKQIQNLKAQVMYLSGQLKQQKKHHQVAIQSIKHLHELEKQRYQQKLVPLQQQLLPLVQQKKQLQRNCQQYEQSLEQLQKEYEKVEIQKQQLANKHQKQLKLINQQKNNLKKQHQILQLTCTHLKSGIDSRYQQIRQFLDQNNKQLQLKYERLLTINSRHQKQIEILINQKQSSKQLHQAAITKRTIKINQLEEKIAKLKVQYQQKISYLIQQKQELQVVQRQLSTQKTLLNQKTQLLAASFAKKQIENNNILQNERDHFKDMLEKYSQKIKQKQSQINKLRELLRIHENDKNIMIDNLRQIENLHKDENIRYINHLNLFQRQIKQLKANKKNQQQAIQNWKTKYEQTSEIKNMINKNYQKDCQLWQKKMNNFQCIRKKVILSQIGNE